MTAAEGEDAIEGLKVDSEGNVYACGPGGIWVISPGGKHLGTLRLPEAAHILACATVTDAPCTSQRSPASTGFDFRFQVSDPNRRFNTHGRQAAARADPA